VTFSTFGPIRWWFPSLLGSSPKNKQTCNTSTRFEFLTTQICFLQGLFNWLGAVAIELVLPREGETKSAQRMNRCLAGWLVSMCFWMLAFYNNHLSFYSDYSSMIKRFVVLFVKDYFWQWPIRPLSLIYGPAMMIAGRLTWIAFRSPPEQDES
jgi:hypothetical protein